MAENKQEVTRRRSVSLMCWIGCALIGLVYLVSIGPAYYALRNGKISQRFFSGMYWPVLKISDHSRFANTLLDRYLSAWYSDEAAIIRQLERWRDQPTNAATTGPSKPPEGMQ